MADKVIFYISTSSTERGTDIETQYSGLHYLSCKGLEDYGKVKNKYQESFADDGTVKVYEPAVLYFEPTDIILTLIFVGPDRQNTYNSFLTNFHKGKFYYYDTIRRKEAYITMFEAVKPSEDKYIGSTPYIQADFKFKNLKGFCEYKEN